MTSSLPHPPAGPARGGAGAEGRWEYRVPRAETLQELLDRLRQIPAEEILLNITEHAALQADGALRRAVVAAAAELMKRVAFSVEAPSPVLRGERERRDVRALPGGTATGRRVSEVSRPDAVRGHRAFGIPVTVLRTSPSSREGAVAAPLSAPHLRLGVSGRRIAFAFAFLAGFLVAAAVLFLAPRAEVAITPITEPINTDLALRASAHVSNADPGEGVVPARLLHVEREVEGVFPVTSMVEKGDRASGTIKVVNRTGAEQRLKGGSRLRADNGVVLRMDESAVVPPQGEADVKVTADEGGTKGNLQSGELSFAALPEETQSILFGRVGSPLLGGTDQPVATLAKEDIARATQELLATHREELREQLRAERPSDALAREEFLQVSLTDSVPRERLGAEVSEFHLRGMLRGEAFTVRESELTSIIVAMAAARSGGQMTLGYPPSIDTLRVEQVRFDEGTADLAVQVENLVHARFDITLLKERLAGRTPEGAREYVTALPGVKDVRVHLGPFWVRRVPTIPRNIQITLELP